MKISLREDITWQIPRVCGDDIYIQGALTNPSFRQIKSVFCLITIIKPKPKRTQWKSDKLNEKPQGANDNSKLKC